MPIRVLMRVRKESGSGFESGLGSARTIREPYRNRVDMR